MRGASVTVPVANGNELQLRLSPISWDGLGGNDMFEFAYVGRRGHGRTYRVKRVRRDDGCTTTTTYGTAVMADNYSVGS